MSDQAIMDVKHAFHRLIAALNAGDVDALKRDAHPDWTLFWIDGGVLDETFRKDPDQWATNLLAAYQAGFKPSLEVQNLDVSIYQDTAVFTCYLVGAIALPGGGSITGTWRDSGTWVRREGRWKEVHAHFSPLIPATSQS